MPPFGFNGPSYTSQSPNFSDTMAMNFYPESAEGNPAVSPIALYPTSGLKLFSDLTDTPVRGEITVNDRTFSVAGSRFYEIDSTGTKTEWGIVANDSLLVHMAAGTTQILISSVGAGYVFDFSTNTFIVLPLGTFLGLISFVAYVDGYFIALLANSNQFQISALLDATSWNPLDTAKVSVFVGNVLAMIGDHREIWFFGERQTQVYTNTGNADFPFEVISGAFIEAGIFAPNTLAQLDNSLFWLGGDDRGAGVAWRASGYTPTRVSNHAVEFAWQGYLQQYGPTGLSGAVAYSFQDQGHSFWQIYFPVPSKTWVFDVATNMWHERGAWVKSNALFVAHHSYVHTFNFGKHLVGDWASGKIYDMSIAYYDDDGVEIRRVRRAPQVATDQKYTFHSQLQVYLEGGLGPVPPLSLPVSGLASFTLDDGAGGFWRITILDSGLLSSALSVAPAVTFFLNDSYLPLTSWQVGVTALGLLTLTAAAYSAAHPFSVDIITFPSSFQSSISVFNGLLATAIPFPAAFRPPVANLRWSDDGGKTWSNLQTVSAGFAGEFSKRVIFRRLGRTRGRIYEFSVSDPVPWRITDSYLDLQQGSGA